MKGCLPHKFAGDNTLRNATNVAFEILGENTGGILILDLKTFEISFQGLYEFYGPDIVFTEEMQMAWIYSRCYALYGEDAVYTDAKGEQQLIWEVSEPQKVTTKYDDMRIRRYTVKVRGNKVNAPTPQQLVYDAYRLPLMNAEGDEKSFAQPLVPVNIQRPDGVVECSAILFPTLQSTPRLMKIQWKGPALKLLTAVPEDLMETSETDKLKTWEFCQATVTDSIQTVTQIDPSAHLLLARETKKIQKLSGDLLVQKTRWLLRRLDYNIPSLSPQTARSIIVMIANAVGATTAEASTSTRWTPEQIDVGTSIAARLQDSFPDTFRTLVAMMLSGSASIEFLATVDDNKLIAKAQELQAQILAQNRHGKMTNAPATSSNQSLTEAIGNLRSSAQSALSMHEAEQLDMMTTNIYHGLSKLAEVTHLDMINETLPHGGGAHSMNITLHKLAVELANSDEAPTILDRVLTSFNDTIRHRFNDECFELHAVAVNSDIATRGGKPNTSAPPSLLKTHLRIGLDVEYQPSIDVLPQFARVVSTPTDNNGQFSETEINELSVRYAMKINPETTLGTELTPSVLIRTQTTTIIVNMSFLALPGAISEHRRHWQSADKAQRDSQAEADRVTRQQQGEVTERLSEEFRQSVANTISQMRASADSKTTPWSELTAATAANSPLLEDLLDAIPISAVPTTTCATTTTAQATSIVTQHAQLWNEINAPQDPWEPVLSLAQIKSTPDAFRRLWSVLSQIDGWTSPMLAMAIVMQAVRLQITGPHLTQLLKNDIGLTPLI